MVSEYPLVSVVMPVFNGLPWLSEAVESILNQSYENLEFVIVDDCSDDGSVQLLKTYAVEDSRIKLILNSSNAGVPATLNRGIEHCSGKYVARMDADDVSTPDRIRLQVEHMEKHPACGVVGSWIYRVRQKGRTRIKAFPEKNDDLKLLLLFECCFSHPSVMMRKKVLDQLPFVYDESFSSAQDYELWSRLKDYCDFYCIQQPLLRYRELETSVSKQAKKARTKRARVDRIYQSLFDSCGLSAECSIALHKQIVHREHRASLAPAEVDAHLVSVFDTYPSAGNRNDIRQMVFRNLVKNPVFRFRSWIDVLRR
jgi:glycosyltransferase involved in cell wall biosynthesis